MTSPSKPTKKKRGRPAVERGIYASISTIAGELGVGRQTLMRKLSESGVGPAKVTGNRELWRLRDVARCWFGESITDPLKRSAFARKALAQAQSEELRLAARRLELIEKTDVHDTFAETFKVLAQFLMVLPDVFEREALVDGVGAEGMATRIKFLRRELAARLRLQQAEADDGRRQHGSRGSGRGGRRRRRLMLAPPKPP